MYWRKSSIDAENNKLPEPHVTFDLYQSTDDYAPYIKFDIDMFGGVIYPWCVMRPFGTKYGGEIINRFHHFYEAYNYLSDLVEKEMEALTHAIEHMKQTVGYDLLPIIPTPEMMQAGSQIKPNPEKDGSWGYVNRVYHAMIGAAPTVKQNLTVEPPQENRGAPEGWQLVPKTPYIRMIDAGEIHASSNIEDLVSECRSRAVRVYEAMLSSAPEPPQERKD